MGQFEARFFFILAIANGRTSQIFQHGTVCGASLTYATPYLCQYLCVYRLSVH